MTRFEQEECPCCFRGVIVNGTCSRCGVVMPCNIDKRVAHPHARPRRRPDQDTTNAFTDYARTKEDKAS
jgi:hypothetical protein